jgi:hypothetical protein
MVMFTLPWLLDGGQHRQCVAGGADVVHAQDMRSTLDGHDGRGDRAGETLLDGAAGDGFDHPIAGETHHEWRTERRELPQLVERRHVVRERLAESEAGMDGHQVPAHTGGLGRGHPLGEEGPDLGHDIPVVGRALHRRRLVLHVHQAHGYAKFGRGVEGPGNTQRPDVVDHAGPARTAARITSGQDVSTDRGSAVTRARRSTTGTTRSSSSSTVGGSQLHRQPPAPASLSTTRAASRRATGMRNGEQET